jgi:probable addiction module antidote protein
MKTRDYREGLLKRLNDPDYAAGYLSDVLTEENPEAFLIALRDVLDARRQNISKISKASGVTRQTVYLALSKTGNPRLSTLTHILDSLGFQLAISRKLSAP